MVEKIFSGENSEKLWNELKGMYKYYNKEDLLDFLYSLMCQIQKLETKLDEQDRICKQLVD